MSRVNVKAPEPSAESLREAAELLKNKPSMYTAYCYLIERANRLSLRASVACLALLLSSSLAHAACSISLADLERVNDWANSKPYVHYYGRDWTGMDEFLRLGGNCYDKATAKMLVLGSVCTWSDMKIVEGMTEEGAHAVLRVTTPSGFKYLDNRFKDIGDNARGMK